MSEQQNVKVVQRGFEAFGRGDIPALLALLTDDVEWYAVGPTDVLPWVGLRHGHEQVGQFFAALGEAVEFQEFEPREFIAQGDKVVVLGHTRQSIRGTSIALNWVMVFTVQDGKIAKYQYFDDPTASVAAMQGA